MSYTARRMGDRFACEIVGLRLWEDIDASTVEELRALWAEHGVLIFRRQALSEHEWADFCARFGPLELTVRRDWASSVRPEVGIISNLKDGNGKSIGGLADGEIFWHSDQSYMLNPATGAGLYAVEIAYEGGTTRWANLARAYEALPERLRNAVEGRHAIFSYPKRLAGYKGADRTVPKEMKDSTPDVIHPIVHAHPVTGRKSLYLDPTTSIGIVGMDEVAGNALLDELTEFATRPEFVYQHEWQVGDALIWDNGFLLHQRDPFPATEKRLMKRTTMILPKDRHMVPAGRVADSALTPP
ncbi:MAG: TauD/TfdA family dioxygenase [Pseudomonadota bacterium]